jgi:hypothetical protein
MSVRVKINSDLIADAKTAPREMVIRDKDRVTLLSRDSMTVCSGSAGSAFGWEPLRHGSGRVSPHAVNQGTRDSTILGSRRLPQVEEPRQ